METTTPITPGHRLGFTSLDEEVTVDELEVEGRIPSWLSGSLLRLSPAKFEVGKRTVGHWFDGLAMMHRFSFAGDRVAYGNRFVRSKAYRDAEGGTNSFGGFATDPCGSIFRRFVSMFDSSNAFNDNTNVNFTRLGDKFLAMTETPMALTVDPETLETLGLVDAAPGAHMTPHPHRSPRSGEMLGYTAHLARKSEYRVYSLSSADAEPNILGAFPVKEPAYIHSFAVTQNYAVVVEYPYTANPINLKLRRRPFIENFKWHGDRPTRFIVFDLRQGGIVGAFDGEPFYCFHHINAFEDGEDIVVDLAAYPDSQVIDSLYLEPLRTGSRPIPASHLRRCRVSLASGTVSEEVRVDEFLELPGINYGRCNARPYRYAYGLGVPAEIPGDAWRDDFLNQINKVDVEERTVETWAEPGCYPGEPVIVEAPEAGTEDDGVVLSVVLDTRAGHSFVLVLDAQSFTELARVRAPHHIPLGFHGQFLPR